MPDVIYVKTLYQQVDLIKKALALLTLTQSYEKIYDTKKQVSVMQAIMLAKMNNLLAKLKKQVTYWKYNYTQILLDEVYSKINGANPDFENLSQEYLTTEEVKAAISDIDTALAPYSDYIMDQYAIDTTAKNSLDLLEQTKQGDLTVMKYVFGKKVTEQLDDVLAQTSSDYADLQNDIYTMDSSFNKRIINHLLNFETTITALMSVYENLQILQKLFDLITYLFRDKADYSSSKMKDFIAMQDYPSFEAACKNYVEVL